VIVVGKGKRWGSLFLEFLEPFSSDPQIEPSGFYTVSTESGFSLFFVLHIEIL